MRLSKLPFKSEQDFPIEVLRRPLRSTDDTKVCNNNWSKKKTWDFAIVYNPVYLAEQQHFRFYKCFLSHTFCDFLVPCRTFKLDNAWYPHVAHFRRICTLFENPGKSLILKEYIFWNETLWTNFKHNVMQWDLQKILFNFGKWGD